MLTALLGGRSLPAGELARLSGGVTVHGECAPQDARLPVAGSQRFDAGKTRHDAFNDGGDG